MGVNQYHDETFEIIARQIISEYDPGLLREPGPVPIETIIEKIFGLTIEFQYIRSDGRILGETIFEDCVIPIYERENGKGYKIIHVKAGTIIIDASLIHNRGDGRFRYTCSHELAHWTIHKDYFTIHGKVAAKSINATRSSETDKTIERQADRLASRLLMPKSTVKKAYYRNHSSSKIIADLSDLYGVSRQAMEIRLKELGLIS